MQSHSPGWSYLPCAWRASLANSVNATYQVIAPEAVRYWLGVIQADPGAGHSIEGQVGFINPGGCQLPIQQQRVLFIWPLVAEAFALLLIAFIVLCALRYRSCSRL